MVLEEVQVLYEPIPQTFETIISDKDGNCRFS